MKAGQRLQVTWKLYFAVLLHPQRSPWGSMAFLYNFPSSLLKGCTQLFPGVDSQLATEVVSLSVNHLLQENRSAANCQENYHNLPGTHQQEGLSGCASSPSHHIAVSAYRTPNPGKYNLWKPANENVPQGFIFVFLANTEIFEIDSDFVNNLLKYFTEDSEAIATSSGFLAPQFSLFPPSLQ